MLSQALSQHLRKQHKMSTAHNTRLPMCRSDILKAYLKTHQPSSRMSTIGECSLCSRAECVYMRLDKHVSQEHGLNMRQYSTRLEM